MKKHSIAEKIIQTHLTFGNIVKREMMGGAEFVTLFDGFSGFIKVGSNQNVIRVYDGSDRQFYELWSNGHCVKY